ncbi:conserved protein of unknown function [Methylacidimicrobium sp. AP8]|uniref:hypothetical protein n=1 Tax=Methylacidimicrobium sp. AP8 TaxID=2730359 RepID=UPI0018C139E5|nr:hypothetical protein [Methylacidimicrobium sp. AP8]CAB4243660.1 conserved protein of unknown function [Methylacidimicrobium sp. AP8]
MKLESLQQITAALNAAGARFLVVGGLAVVAHGYGRSTMDMDLVVDFSPRNLSAVFSALARLGYRPVPPVDPLALADPSVRKRWIEEKGMRVLPLQSEAHWETPIDIFIDEPFSFEREYKHALQERLPGGEPIRFVRVETLIAMKQGAGRHQDLADVAELKLSIEEGGGRNGS